MERHFHYRDSKGVLQTEVLSSEQGNLDEQILRTFTYLENAVSAGQSLTTEISRERVTEVKRQIDELPPNRALHWVGELERIGAIAKAPKKVDDKKESTGGSK